MQRNRILAFFVGYEVLCMLHVQHVYMYFTQAVAKMANSLFWCCSVLPGKNWLNPLCEKPKSAAAFYKFSDTVFSNMTPF